MADELVGMISQQGFYFDSPNLQDIFNIEHYLKWYWWVGVGGFSKVVATFNHVGGSFNIFMTTKGDV